MTRSDQSSTVTSPIWIRRVLGRLGEFVIDFCGLVVYLTSLMCVVTALTMQPRRWRRTNRQVFAMQLMRSGVDTIIPVGMIALLVGVLVVMQIQLWLGKVGHTEWMSSLLVIVVVRELAPLLTNLIMIMRNGSEVTTELATMTVAGKVRMLDAQGIDPILYLIMPRVAAMVISTFCLTLLFIIFSFFSGYLVNVSLGLRVSAPGIFLNQLLRALQWEDIVNLLVTSLVPPLFTGLICCSEGLGVTISSTAIPVATRHALSRSVVSLFLISVSTSVLTYL